MVLGKRVSPLESITSLETKLKPIDVDNPFTEDADVIFSDGLSNNSEESGSDDESSDDDAELLREYEKLKRERE